MQSELVSGSARKSRKLNSANADQPHAHRKLYDACMRMLAEMQSIYPPGSLGPMRNACSNKLQGHNQCPYAWATTHLNVCQLLLVCELLRLLRAAHLEATPCSCSSATLW